MTEGDADLTDIDLRGASLGSNLVPNPGFEPASGGLEPWGWQAWAPRPALAPETALERGPAGWQVRMTARDVASYGKLIASGIVVKPGARYRASVRFRYRDIACPTMSLAALLSWRASPGGCLIARDYLSDPEWPGSDGSVCLSRALDAPEGATAVDLELWFRWAPGGVVWWQDAEVVGVPAPRHRLVRMATTRLLPRRPTSLERNLQLVADLLNRAGELRPDVVCLPEAVITSGLDGPKDDLAQPIPGPATEVLAAAAERASMYVVTSLYERVESHRGVYNTAVLIDRRGQVVGKYRKTHLPLAEAEWGVVPGEELPVFDTDFGRIGLMVCWDNWFPEVARGLARQGAEVIFLPIEGDGSLGEPGHWDVISRARAIDNSVYLVAAQQQMEGRIVGPEGELLAETSRANDLSVVTVDLDSKRGQQYLSVGPCVGEPRSLFFKERRPDLYSVLQKG